MAIIFYLHVQPSDTKTIDTMITILEPDLIINYNNPVNKYTNKPNSDFSSFKIRTGSKLNTQEFNSYGLEFYDQITQSDSGAGSDSENEFSYISGLPNFDIKIKSKFLAKIYSTPVDNINVPICIEITKEATSYGLDLRDDIYNCLNEKEKEGDIKLMVSKVYDKRDLNKCIHFYNKKTMKVTELYKQDDDDDDEETFGGGNLIQINKKKYSKKKNNFLKNKRSRIK